MTATIETSQEFDFSALPITSKYIGIHTNDSGWQHHLWRVNLTWSNGYHSFDYRMGMGHQSKPKATWQKPVPKKPDNKEIIHSLLMDSEAADISFADWCSNYGYSDDTISALNIYQACCKTAVFLRKAFAQEQIAEMRVALEDY